MDKKEESFLFVFPLLYKELDLLMRKVSQLLSEMLLNNRMSEKGDMLEDLLLCLC